MKGTTILDCSFMSNCSLFLGCPLNNFGTPIYLHIQLQAIRNLYPIKEI